VLEDGRGVDDAQPSPELPDGRRKAVLEDEAFDGLEGLSLALGQLFAQFVYHFVHHLYNKPETGPCQVEFLECGSLAEIGKVYIQTIFISLSSCSNSLSPASSSPLFTFVRAAAKQSA